MKPLNNRAYPLGVSFLIGLFLYGLILLYPPPESFAIFFHEYSPGLFFGLVTMLSVGYLLPGKWGKLIPLPLTMALFALPLTYLWSSGFSDATIIGGFLPYKDSFHFYSGSRFLLQGDRIPGAAWLPAERPLYPAFLSSLLFLTGQNLQLTLAVSIALLAISAYLAAQTIHLEFGSVPSAIFLSLLYIFSLPWLGNTQSEIHGLMLGCLGFVFLWMSTKNHGLWLKCCGIAIITLAVSSRAGPFLIFPALILWGSITEERHTRFSINRFVLLSLTFLFSFLLSNIALRRLVVAPGTGSALFGNFAYALYGQVKGGLGWLSGAQLGLSSSDVLKVSINHLVLHPEGFMKASITSFKDFFLPSWMGIFSFVSTQDLSWIDRLLWFGFLGMFILGVIFLIRSVERSYSKLLLFSLVGILLSVPFLPPMDGGNRFFASIMPFFFAICVYPMQSITSRVQRGLGNIEQKLLFANGVASSILIIMTLILPVSILVIRNLNQPQIVTSECSDNLAPFAFVLSPNSYIDLSIRDDVKEYIPLVLNHEFISNTTESHQDDFIQTLFTLIVGTGNGVRIIPANDLVNGGIHYFVGNQEIFIPIPDHSIVFGCAEQIKTRNQSILRMVTTRFTPP